MHAEFEVFRSCYHHIGGDATDGGKHGGADGGGIMAEDAYKLLNFFALDESDGGGKGWLDWLSFVAFCSIEGAGGSMSGEMLWARGCFVTESVAALRCLVRYTKVHLTIRIIPIKVDAKKYFSVPVNGAFICF